MKNFIILLLLFSFWGQQWPHALQAQPSSYELYAQANAYSVSSSDGLVNNLIISVLQDHKGYIWAGTFGGLVRYDGVSIRNFKHNANDPNSLARNRVDYLFEDSRKRLWVFMPRNIQLYDAYKEHFVNADHINLDTLNAVYDCVEDVHHNIWMAAGCLLRYSIEQDTFFIYNNRPDLPAVNLFRLLLDQNGDLLVAGRSAPVYKYNAIKDQFTQLNNTNVPGLRISDCSVEKLYQDRNKNIWLGTFNHSAFVLQPGDSTFQQVLIDPKVNYTTRVRAFFEDLEGSLFVGTRYGLYKQQHQKFIRYAHVDHPITPMRHNSVMASCMDRSGCAWLGTFAGGLTCLNLFPKNFPCIQFVKDNNRFLNDKMVYSVHHDDQGDLWIGTETGGLNHYNSTTGLMEYFKHEPGNPHSISNDEIRAIVSDSVGNLWLGINKGGVSYFDRRTKQAINYTHVNGDANTLARNDVLNLLLDDDANLWITYGNGMQVLNTRTGQLSKVPEQVASPAKTSTGQLWFAIKSNGEGICSYNPKDKSFTEYPNLKIFSSRIFSAIHVDSKDNIWMGNENGCARFNTKTKDYTMFGNEYGHPIDIVTAIEEHNGDIWMATNSNGLVKLKGAVGSSDANVPISIYTENEGLRSNEFNLAASTKGKNGRLYFGGVAGLTYFNPDHISENPFVPNVTVSELRIFNKPVHVGDTIAGIPVLDRAISETEHLTLSYKHNVFSFEFSNFHYAKPMANKYAYMMEGVDNDWRLTSGDRHYASYTSLPGGEYTFLLKGANSDGLWNPSPYKLRITVLPPWWKTIWFVSILILVMVLLAFLIYLVRVKQLKHNQQMLVQTVRERTRELYLANASLKEKQEEVMQQNEEIVQQNHEITHQKEDLEIKNRELAAAYTDMRILSEFGQKVTSTLKLAEVGDMVYSHIAHLVPLDTFGLGLYSEKHQYINFVTFIERGNAIAPFKSRMDDPTSLAAWTIRNRQEVYSGNYKKEHPKYISKLKLRSSDVPQSIIDVPLVIDQRIVGVLTVQSYLLDAYNQKDLTNIRSLAAYFAIALDNANAYQTIEQQNAGIKASISYAKTIQEAILPTHEFIKAKFDCFIFYRPRDIVSGDFYWSTSIPNNNSKHPLFKEHPNCSEAFFLAVVDCTGHGVPGAFMSMIGSRLLSEVVNVQEMYDPGEILEQLDTNIVKVLKQDESRNDDGMDVSLVRILIEKSSKRRQVVFAGAKSSLYVYKHQTKELIMERGSVKNIGGPNYSLLIKKFVERTFDLEHDDVLYLSTDGYIDQNDSFRKRFKVSRMLGLLESIGHRPIAEQGALLVDTFDKHKQNEQQRDDVTVIGLKL